MSTIRLYSSNFDENTGISTATIATDYGFFSATSKLHEEDLDISSSYAGCEYAEIRATIKYIRKRIEVLNNQITGLENYQKQLLGRADYDPKSTENIVLRKQIDILKREKEDWRRRKESLTNALVIKMNSRRTIVNAIANKKGE
jgi:predicted  nucleic acid-binding Zn-ribbon protein